MLNMSNLIYNNQSCSVLVDTKQGGNIFGSIFKVKLGQLGGKG